ncbi:ABC transporter ATP-binding protein [Spirochaeta lutea]|uniref:ABC transporter ATP-binding protein n=1 Tax=Spirochaeta lutea TaxID=1480694 RepID=UPI00068A5639|nr:ATP-binding cassette domain-containing protein [Spirochaeta lutea]
MDAVKNRDADWGLSGVRFTYPDTGIEIARNLELALPGGKITAVLGPSGCGKSTLLHVLSGELDPQEGEADIPGDGNVSMIYQDPRLIPWKSVEGNLEFVLRGWFEAQERRRRIAQGLDLVGLGGRARDLPDQLSGGQRQRVNMLRAFLVPGDVLLMDEPFQGLDVVLRIQLLEVFARLWLERPRSVLAVTHEPRDAALLGHQCLIVSGPPVRIEGRITGLGPRLDVGAGDDGTAGVETRIIAQLMASGRRGTGSSG